MEVSNSSAINSGSVSTRTNTDTSRQGQAELASLTVTASGIVGIVVGLEEKQLQRQQHTDNESIVSVTESSSSLSGSSSSSASSVEGDEAGGRKKNKSKWKKSKFWRYRGFIYTLFSSIFFSLTALVVKYLKDYHPVNLVLWRFQGAFLPSIPFLVMHLMAERRKVTAKTVKDNISSVEAQPGKINGLNNQIMVQNKQIISSPPSTSQKQGKVKWTQWKVVALLLARSILTCNALILHFYSLKYLGLSDALVISSSTPVFAYFFAHYFLGESCGIIPILASFATLFGVVVITRPIKLFATDDYDFETLIGVGLALGCTLLSTASFITLRYMKRIHYSTTLFAFGSWGTFENLVIALAIGVFSFPRTETDWYLAGTLCVLTFFGQIAIILALKTEQTGPVSLVRTCDVIFGFFWQTALDKQLPDVYSFIGAAIVITCLFLTAIRKYLAHLPDDHNTKLRFWFILK